MRNEVRQWILRGEPFQMNGNGSVAGFPAILGHLIEQRGLPAGDQLEGFLHPRLRDIGDPFEIVDMQPAVERVLRAVDAGEQVCIFGDYDVDGVSSVAVMRRMLKAYGLDPRHFIPRRSSEGYGLSKVALERCMSEGAKPDLLIAVDCGTVSVDEIAGLRADGIDVIVVDHHEPGPGGRPDVVALVNPKCGGGPEYLCAAGVCFKLCHALLKTRPVEGFDLKSLLEFVTLATVADIVPMVGENRLMVRHGLKRLPTTLNPGLQALQKMVGMNGRATSMDIGFRIGPRLNAAGRMDVPEDALGILLTDCRRRALDFAERLEGYNKRRQQHEARIRKEALEMLAERDPDEPVIVLGSRDWHPDVVGIVASRIARHYNRPAVVLGMDEDGCMRGSCRSIEAFDILEGLHTCSSHLIKYGGHRAAAGVTLAANALGAFRNAFNAAVSSELQPHDLQPVLNIDAAVSGDILTDDFLAQLRQLQPFGQDNPEPVWALYGIDVATPPHTVGNNHLKFSVSSNGLTLDAIAFNYPRECLPEGPLDIAFTVKEDRWNGRTRLQLHVRDIRKSEKV
jgi:single-stranded-DNA-specific exonuclease